MASVKCREIIKVKTITVLFILFLSLVSSAQQHRSGYIYTEIANKIAVMPGDSGNHFVQVDSSDLKTWGRSLLDLLSGNISQAALRADSIAYNLIDFTDTFDIPNRQYYILETADSNYWGSYVFNPNYCRSLVIQSPHAIRDINTGLQGLHVFQKTEAMFFMVNGTHRCNSSTFSSCSGTTSSCSGGAGSEPYRISDLAHNTMSLFQKTTEVLLNTFSHTYFIQLHGFSKQSSDPYVILSNGTDKSPTLDFMPILKNELLLQDPVLTFKIAHIDTSWTRLRGFWNTQGRLINGETDPCMQNATRSNGRFFHIEQERIRLRDDVNAWNKMANALQNTFNCSPALLRSNAKKEMPVIYPNPTRDFLVIQFEEQREDMVYFEIFDVNGFIVKSVMINQKSAKIDVSALDPSLYFYSVKSNSSLFRGKFVIQ
ncbi:T9SS type A sorting domain-containing protein [Hyphobacterium sp. CCMP332]|nr:T9SS type A sorting domain-containing protein [Hyphobacterium sp. CCMP332]